MTPQRASGRKQAKRIAALGRQRRMLQLKQNRKPLIPSEVLRALAEMHLPKNKRVYNARLRELLGA